MGGCCCCSSEETELSAPPAYYYYPRALEEHVPLSTHPSAASAFPGGFLVDTNLDTSSPDTYRPPPAPIPFSVTLGANQTPPVTTFLHPANSNSLQETVAGNNDVALAESEELKKSESQVQADTKIDSAKDSEVELPKSAEHVILAEEEDSCPICLEGYDAENPKLTTKCMHHFHLACILEWMERSETCPVCDEDVVFNPSLD